MARLYLHRLALLALIVMTFHGCAQRPVRLDVDQDLQAQLRQVEHWQAKGKLGVRLGNEAHSAWFDWQHQSENFSLRLTGPFGQGTTWLRRQGETVSLESQDEPIRYAASPEALMQQQLGWQVPVGNLRYWIKGVAAPGLEVSRFARNPDGTLAELHQQGWQLSYSRYRMVDGWALPGKLIASHSGLRLTLIIKSWELAKGQEAARL